MNRPSHSHWRCERGSAAVEFALILPLMTLLLFGFFEAGRMFYTFNIASSAARDAARFGARLPMTCGGFTTPGDETRVKTLAATGDASAGAAALIHGMTASDISVAYGCVGNSLQTYSGVYKNVAGVPTVTVTVNAPFQTLFQSLLPGMTINGVTVSHSETWTE